MALNDVINYRLIYRRPGDGSLQSMLCIIQQKPPYDGFLLHAIIQRDANQNAILLEREVVAAIDDHGIIAFVAPHAKAGEIEKIRREFLGVLGISFSALLDMLRIEAFKNRTEP